MFSFTLTNVEEKKLYDPKLFSQTYKLTLAVLVTRSTVTLEFRVRISAVTYFYFYFGPPFYSMLHLLISNDRRPSFRWHIFFLSGLLHRYRIIRDRIFSFQIEVEYFEGITFLPADIWGVFTCY